MAPELKKTHAFPVIIGVTLFFFLSVAFHADYINGPLYWKWPWQRLDSLPLFSNMVLVAVPFILAQFLYDQKRLSTSGALLWMMAAVFWSQLALCCLQNPGRNLLRIVDIITSPYATTYLTEALRVTGIKEFLGNFHHLLAGMQQHAINKPPGPILFYSLLLTWFPLPPAAALVGGLIIGVLATTVIPATFFLVKALTRDQDAAFAAASLMVFMPGLILFFPEFDQIFPVFICLLIGFWALVLQENKLVYSFISGIIFSVILFVTFNVLVIGAFIVAITVFHLIKTKGEAWRHILQHLLMFVFVVIGVYAVLWMLTGYSLPETFMQCLNMQNKWVGTVNRPHSATILFDLTDFLLGAGWIPLIIGIMFFWQKTVQKTRDQYFWLSAFCFFQILLAAVSCLYPGETARDWIFLLPILMIPASFQMKTFSFRGRMIVYGCLWLLLGVIGQNIIFITI